MGCPDGSEVGGAPPCAGAVDDPLPEVTAFAPTAVAMTVPAAMPAPTRASLTPTPRRFDPGGSVGMVTPFVSSDTGDGVARPRVGQPGSSQSHGNGKPTLSR